MTLFDKRTYKYLVFNVHIPSNPSMVQCGENGKRKGGENRVLLPGRNQLDLWTLDKLFIISRTHLNMSIYSSVIVENLSPEIDQVRFHSSSPQ